MQAQPEGQPEGQAPTQNRIIHTDTRVFFAVGIAPGVELNFSMSDQDIEQLYEVRQERKRKARLQLLAPGKN